MFKGFEARLLIDAGRATRILFLSGPLKKCSIFKSILQNGLNVVGPNGFVSMSEVIKLEGR